MPSVDAFYRLSFKKLNITPRSDDKENVARVQFVASAEIAEHSIASQLLIHHAQNDNVVT